MPHAMILCIYAKGTVHDEAELSRNRKPTAPAPCCSRLGVLGVRCRMLETELRMSHVEYMLVVCGLWVYIHITYYILCICSLQSAVCSLQSAVCSVYNLQSAIYNAEANVHVYFSGHV